MRIALVSRDNGVGLSADMQLLEGMFVAAGHDVARVDWRLGMMARVDVAVFLELWSARLARCAKTTIGIFNLEWFQNGWVRDLPGITQLWAKSREAEQVYDRLRVHRSATYTGFLARDLYDPTVPRQLSCLHVRGKSDFKNTRAVIETWRRDPKLPPLTIISAIPLDVPDYVTVLRSVTPERLREEMNRAEIHLCPSRSEGWGHYLAEALSVGALIVTLDASPMNEHVQPEWGVLVPAASSQPYGLVTAHAVSPRLLREGIVQAVRTPAGQRAQMGERARAHFHARNTEFRTVALDLLERINHAPVRGTDSRAGIVREADEKEIPRHRRDRHHSRSRRGVPEE